MRHDLPPSPSSLWQRVGLVIAGLRNRFSAQARRGDQALAAIRGDALAEQCCMQRFFSPLMRRILLLNTLPLALLAVTLLFLNDFQNSLLETDVIALREQARIYAAALGQSAVIRATSQFVVPGTDFILDPGLARPLLLRLTEPSPNVHARLVGPDGALLADSLNDAVRLPRAFIGRRHVWRLPPPHWAPPRNNRLEIVYEWLLSFIPLTSREGIVTLDAPDGPMPDFDPAMPYFGAETAPYIRRTRDQQLVITIAEPVIHEGQTVGIIQLTRRAQEVDHSLFAVRSSILTLFLMALIVTVMLSWYLALTIAQPLLRLTAASNDMTDRPGRADVIPEFLLSRHDEIGVLARALRKSVLALWARMDAIERFAADVSHEIKNPLSSIRSAIETLPRISDTKLRNRLLNIIESDVKRLDRLITDISDASRVDAELSRHSLERVAVDTILLTLVEILQATGNDGDPEYQVHIERRSGQTLEVLAVEGRLVQVFRNLLGNAASFSPKGGRVRILGKVVDGWVVVTIDDEGPGIPQGKLEEIFDRFYSERPDSENFGQHSGLGLAISRQIAEALSGSLTAENRCDENGVVVGARFTVRLPKAG